MNVLPTACGQGLWGHSENALHSFFTVTAGVGVWQEYLIRVTIKRQPP